MSAPRNNEPQANYELARSLRRRNPSWTDATLHAERTSVIQQAGPGVGSAQRPDIVVAPALSQPVILETEFAPARTVEQDAIARLGGRLTATGAAIEGALSVVLPEGLRTGDLRAVDEAEFRYATHYLDARGENGRWPESGWLRGGVDDLADAVECLSLSERQLALGSETLRMVVDQAAARLAGHAPGKPLARIAEALHQGPGVQTERMAAAIFVSAFMFHAAVEDSEGVPASLAPGAVNKWALLEAWNEILKVNYWPIFSIARDLVNVMPLRAVAPVLSPVAAAIPDLVQLGATTYHDLAGRMFQTLIADRKFLATFYTLPQSACLLAEMAVDRMGVAWSDRSAIESLRIADFACGTGALLSAAQRAVYRRYRRAGGDDRDLHRAAMERVLMGLDIMPAGTHLTCSMLSSAHPALSYGESEVHTVSYGIQGNRTHIGALDLLNSNHSYSLFATGSSMGGTEVEASGKHSVTVMDKSCDLVIMNPPFTRPTNHEAGHAAIPVPSFAGFSTSHLEQQAMASKLRRRTGPFGSGNAGLASNFMDLGHCKLKDGGVLALVLPFSFARGQSWRKAREALRANYSDIQVTAIAAVGSTDRAFSADTAMAECLLVAVKKGGGKSLAAYSNLPARPGSLLEATVEARATASRAVPGSVVDGGAAGVRSTEVAKAAAGLAAGKLRLPRTPGVLDLPITNLGAVAARGPVHRDINGGPPSSPEDAPPRGPFVVRPIRSGEVPTYPMLWAHCAARERSLVVLPDSCGDPWPDDEDRAVELWVQAASRLHSNLDFRLNSQSLAMCLTPEKCLGGRAWPSVIPDKPQYEIPLLLWANSTLGVILFWWLGTRQQQGRACITVKRLPGLPVLDPRTLTDHQLDQCSEIFEEFRGRAFLPANEAYRDSARKDLDQALLFGIVSVLQIDPALEEGLDVLRRQWCAEPSVHGGKRTRIGG